MSCPVCNNTHDGSPVKDCPRGSAMNFETLGEYIATQEAERDAIRARISVLTEAMKDLADNFNHAGNPPQPWADMVDSWHYIAREALAKAKEKP